MSGPSGPTGMAEEAFVRIACDPAVERLLANCGLPASDAGAPQVHLYGRRRDGQPAGVVGLEVYGPEGLLRSLAVAASERRTGLGRALVAYAEDQAAALGVEQLYLLTTSAAEFFTRLGYRRVPRSEAPPSIAATSQFTELCPASAVLMSKVLGGRVCRGG